jgi:ligand-binding sensor domain-containing protein/signal transduction histidine kinase
MGLTSLLRNLNTCPSCNRRCPFFFVRIALVMAVIAADSSAVDRKGAFPQYVHDKWGPEAGIPGGTVFSIAQTTDGYLWLGTGAGLIRYDGLSFRAMADTPGLNRGPVFKVTPDRYGNLWLEHPGPRMFRYRDGTQADIVPGIPFIEATAVIERADGSLVAATTSPNRILIYRQGKITDLVSQDGLPHLLVTSFAQTTDGTIWIGTRDAGLFRVERGQLARVAGISDVKINCLLSGTHGNLWIGTDHGIAHTSGSGVTEVPMGVGIASQVLSMARDHDGNLWIGTDSDGLVRMNEAGVSRFHVGSALSSNDAVTALFEDREGSLWIGTATGLERLRDKLFVTYSADQGLTASASTPVFIDSKNRLWFATSDGGLGWRKDNLTGRVTPRVIGKKAIYSISGGDGELWLGRRQGGLTHLFPESSRWRVRTYTTRDGLAEDNVFSVYRSRDSSVWAGTLSSGVSRLYHERFTNYSSDNGLGSNSVSFILEDSDGTMWFATPDGLASFSTGNWQRFSERDGLPAAAVNCLFEDSSKVLWVGTAAGLAFRTDRVFHVPARLPKELREPIFGIVEDGAGGVWITTATHVFRVMREHLLRSQLTESDVREFEALDGMAGSEGVARCRSLVADLNGRIWLSLNGGLSAVDPKHITSLLAPPIIHIEGVFADGNAIDLHGPIRVPPATKGIAISYGATILSSPERVRFQYKLDNFDQRWSNPAPLLQALYTNLNPGSYRFRVRATNAYGAWNPLETSVNIKIEPTLEQAWWFRTMLIIIAGVAMVALYRLRLKRLKHQLVLRFEERLAERTRIAQDLHDTLLQGFVSASMQLHVVSDALSDDTPTKHSLEHILQLVRQVIEEGRNAVRGLRLSASGSEDLAQAFSRVPEEVRISPETKFRISIEGKPRTLNALLRDDVYRIGREALVNAFRHAKAKNIEVRIEYGPKHFRFWVRDDGCGLDRTILKSGREGHWGLRGMRERAARIGGSLHLWSEAATGTEVDFSLANRVAFNQKNAYESFARFFQVVPRRLVLHRKGTKEEDDSSDIKSDSCFGRG